MERWPPGKLIYHKDLWRGEILNIFPVTVVQDAPNLLALYSHAGATCLSGQTRGRQNVPIAERIKIFGEKIPKLESRQVRRHVLSLNTPGQHSSVLLFWRMDWEFDGWYVNLEPPYRRIPEGVVKGDHLLDIVVRPNFEWDWKDRDEFDAACEAGIFTAQVRDSVLKEAARMVDRIEQRQTPFSEPWPHWRPDPDWMIPHLTMDEHGQRNLKLSKR
ncbi:MAG: DUF402 domain-containing protein [Chloroflexi bacterium]|nr:DUF402 domain-containing protein [Chloroflexota bacterium]